MSQKKKKKTEIDQWKMLSRHGKQKAKSDRDRQADVTEEN